MAFFDKIKDLFTDEEEVYETKEIEVPEEEEHSLPTFMRNKIEKEEEEKNILELKKKEEKENIAVFVEPPVKKEEKKFSFEFDDDDFVDASRLSRSAVQKEKVIEVAKEPPAPINIKPYSNKKEKDLPKKFKPTPVISPVYGVLNANYKTEEVISKDENSYAIPRASKKVDFESVRKKAYGSLSDDIRENLCENCEYLKEIKVNKKIETLSEEDLLYNLTEEDKNAKKEFAVEQPANTEIKDISISEAEENYDDYGVTYEVPPQRINRNSDVKIVNHANSEVVAEEVEVKENTDDIPVLDSYAEQKKKDLELTDDLFNLIDSMYKERDD